MGWAEKRREVERKSTDSLFPCLMSWGKALLPNPITPYSEAETEKSFYVRGEMRDKMLHTYLHGDFQLGNIFNTPPRRNQLFTSAGQGDEFRSTALEFNSERK